MYIVGVLINISYYKPTTLLKKGLTENLLRKGFITTLLKKGLTENLLRKGFITTLLRKGLTENLLRKNSIENHITA
jgi:hypothetical protein